MAPHPTPYTLLCDKIVDVVDVVDWLCGATVPALGVTKLPSGQDPRGPRAKIQIKIRRSRRERRKKVWGAEC